MINKARVKELASLFEKKSQNWNEDSADFQMITTSLIAATKSFDYKKWLAERKIDINDPVILDTLNLEDLQNLLTVHYRIERFSEGHLVNLANNGYMQRLVNDIEKLL